jgi:hypothetical protein
VILTNGPHGERGLKERGLKTPFLTNRSVEKKRMCVCGVCGILEMEEIGNQATERKKQGKGRDNDKPIR